jgi:hypothetical protein
MKPLILTGRSISDFTESGFADLAVDFFFRFLTNDSLWRWNPMLMRPAP